MAAAREHEDILRLNTIVGVYSNGGIISTVFSIEAVHRYSSTSTLRAERTDGSSTYQKHRIHCCTSYMFLESSRDASSACVLGYYEHWYVGRLWVIHTGIFYTALCIEAAHQRSRRTDGAGSSRGETSHGVYMHAVCEQRERDS